MIYQWKRDVLGNKLLELVMIYIDNNGVDMMIKSILRVV